MNLDWIAPTIAAVVVAFLSIRASNDARAAKRASVETTEKIVAVEVQVAAVKKATDGMTTALVRDAGEKGRAEGAAIATAGAAAVSTTPAAPTK